MNRDERAYGNKTKYITIIIKQEANLISPSFPCTRRQNFPQILQLNKKLLKFLNYFPSCMLRTLITSSKLSTLVLPDHKHLRPE